MNKVGVRENIKEEDFEGRLGYKGESGKMWWFAKNKEEQLKSGWVGGILPTDELNGKEG